MSIATELTLLANSKQAIKNSINQKGGSITDSTPFADYSTAIDNLPSGGSGNPILTSIDVSDFTGTTFNEARRYITSATIPSGVTIINWNAFQNYSSLTNVTVPNTVINFGHACFYGCSRLANISIPEITTTIEYEAFNGCSSLTSVAIPNSVTSIGYSAFDGCTSLENVTLGTGITSLGDRLFSGCTSLTSINIPNSVTKIGAYAFAGCSSLSSIKLSNNITIIANAAFVSCNGLVSIEIGSGITSIGTEAFSGCNRLTSIIINATTPPTLVNANTFNNTNNCPIYVPAASVDVYKAANNWSTYASRIYPIQQVATVDGNPVYNYDLGNKDATTILSTEIVKMPTGTSIEFAEGVVQIGGQLGAYEDVTLPSTFVGFIDTQPINAATEALTSLATTPPTAERDNFGGAGLTAIYVPASAVDTYKAASGWSNFASIIQAIPVPTAMKWTSADETQEISIACEDLVEAGTFTGEDRDNADLDFLIGAVEGSAEIGDCVTTIGDSAFLDCNSLTSVTIPSGVTTIGDSAFSRCEALTSVTIPSGVTSIGNYAFTGCSSLTSVTIPSGVTSMGINTFKDCTLLVSVTVNATTPPTMGRNVFSNTNDCPIYVPAESVDTYKAANNWSSYASRIQAIPTE